MVAEATCPPTAGQARQRRRSSLRHQTRSAACRDPWRPVVLPALRGALAPGGLPAWPAALRSGLTAGTGLGGGAGFLGATEPGPKPVLLTASADAGGFGPSSSTGMPAALACFRPFSTVSIAGSSLRISLSAASISVAA